MPVYMIRAGRHGPVKIGHSKDVKKRFVELQVSNHERLVVLRQLEGGKAEEALLHERFSDHVQRGKWYEFDLAMLDDVGLRDVSPFADAPAPEPGSAEEVLDEVFRISTLARSLGGKRGDADIEALLDQLLRVQGLDVEDAAA